jgi:hypothetical protein
MQKALVLQFLLTFTLLPISLLVGCSEQTETPKVASQLLQLTALRVGTSDLLLNPDMPQPANKKIILGFSSPIDVAIPSGSITLEEVDAAPVALIFSFLDDNKTISLSYVGSLKVNTQYSLKLTEDIVGEKGEVFSGANFLFVTENLPLEILSITVDNQDLNQAKRVIDVNLTPSIQLVFSHQVNPELMAENLSLTNGGSAVDLNIIKNDNDSAFTLSPTTNLKGYKKYLLRVSNELQSVSGNNVEDYSANFYTKTDSIMKYPEISEEDLLTKIQEQTFKYFWNFGHPVSGLARERNTSGETVTTGGSGFGLMAIIVGIERGFITRQEGVARFAKIVNFLAEDADRFHGAWSHWLNGTSGTAIPFSSNDDGADLVETALLTQGLLTVRQYLNTGNVEEAAIIIAINSIWEEIEWEWFTKDGENVLYWHWSPNFGWSQNHKITGWNESLIVYTLAAASPTHNIDKEVYTEGWSRNNAMVNSTNTSYFGFTMPLRSDMGGPLFFAHYSFLGLDPRNLSDQYANYWDQNVNHTLINQAYCQSNPKNYVGYAQYSWGLTASDGNAGYAAHSPNNDKGVITPTAALSSIPYTPDASMTALKHFYYILGDQLWGEYGFYDAFNLTEDWTANSYLAIDQGPIIIMIENYRTGLLWELFMSAPEVKTGLDKLGFTYE